MPDWSHILAAARHLGIAQDDDRLKQMAIEAKLQQQRMKDEMVFSAGGHGGANGTWAPLTSPPPAVPSATLFTTAYFGPRTFVPDKALLMRLRKDDLPAKVIHNVHIYVGGTKVKIFVARSDGEHIVLEDETAMYPSDKIVAAFQLLLKDA